MDTTTSPMKSKPTVLFVGSNPSSASTVNVAFHGSTQSSKILARWIKNVEGTLTYINVSSDKTPDNRPLTSIEIKTNLETLSNNINLVAADKVVALGKTAVRALTLLGVDFYEMPHPSGRNRKLNDKNYEAEKVKGLLSYINQEAP